MNSEESMDAQGQARVRDLVKANEVIDEIKLYEDFVRLVASPAMPTLAHFLCHL